MINASTKAKETKIIIFLVLYLILPSCSQGVVHEYSPASPSSATLSTPIPMNQRSPTPVYRTEIRTSTSMINTPAPVYRTEIPTTKSKPETIFPSVTYPGNFHIKQPEGILFFYIFHGQQPLYTSVDLSEKEIDPCIDCRISPKPMVTDGRITNALAFAPYSSRVAYLDQTPESVVDLWLADLSIKQIEHLWSNNQQWLGPLFSSDNAYIQWGPAEKSLILSSYEAMDHIVIYSLKSKEAIEVVGTCDRIAPLPDSDRLTVWCSFETGAPSPYGVLTFDGDLLYLESLPENNIEVYDWAIAPDNDRIIFAPKQGNIILADDQGMKMELPLHLLYKPFKYRTQPYLQWSSNGDRLLVYAFNEEHCPSWEDPGLGILKDMECWLVIDAKTGEFLWWPEVSAAGIYDVTRIPLINLTSNCAGLSPDSDWIAICYASGAINNFLLISVDGQEVIDIPLPLVTMNFKWTEKLK